MRLARWTWPSRRRTDTPAAGEPPVHLGWQRLRAALRGAQVTPGLIDDGFHRRVGGAGSRRPTPAATVGLLDRYFHGEAREELAEGRFLCHRAGDGQGARQIVARLSHILPELRMLTLATEGDGLVLRCVGAHVVIDPDEVEEQHLSAGTTDYVQRTVTVEALVVATNRLLHDLGHGFRFLPMNAPGDVNAFLAVDPSGAQVLDSIGFWAEPLKDLVDVARWPRPTRQAEPTLLMTLPRAATA